jgi:hypothetical protein
MHGGGGCHTIAEEVYGEQYVIPRNQEYIFLQKEFLVSDILHALTGLTIEIKISKSFWDASNQSFTELTTFHELKLQNVSAYTTKEGKKSLEELIFLILLDYDLAVPLCNWIFFFELWLIGRWSSSILAGIFAEDSE